MFGLGFSEILLLGVLALILIGPKQLPEVARTIARFINEIKRSTDDFKSHLNAANPLHEEKKDHSVEFTNHPSIAATHQAAAEIMPPEHALPVESTVSTVDKKESKDPA
jgi:sec-independent protein translocase protein TatB